MFMTKLHLQMLTPAYLTFPLGEVVDEDAEGAAAVDDAALVGTAAGEVFWVEVTCAAWVVGGTALVAGGGAILVVRVL